MRRGSAPGQLVVFSPRSQVMGAPGQATARGRALWALLLTALGSAAGRPRGAESVCTARPLARYSITFTGKWSQTAFPKQYPLFRPPAQWSSLLGKPPPPALQGDTLLSYLSATNTCGHLPLGSGKARGAGVLGGGCW